MAEWAKTNYLAALISNALFAGVDYTIPQGYVGLVITTPTAAGTATELYYNVGSPSAAHQGYARVDLSDAFDDNSDGATAYVNSLAAITWTPSVAAWTSSNSIKGVCVWDHPNRSTGNMLLFLDIGTQDVLVNQVFTIPQHGWEHVED